MFLRQDNSRGFTLIEILVAIAVIAILSGVVISNLSSARSRSHEVYRRAELKRLQLVLEAYLNDNNAYPSTLNYLGEIKWWGMSVNGGNRTTSGANAYIPGLTPTYISVLPADPSGDTIGWSGFLYISDGTHYKLLSHVNGPEKFPSAGEPFYDPVRPTWALMVCSDEPACSSW